MKKIPLVFFIVLTACSSPKVITTSDFSKYTQPFKIAYVGVWKKGYSVLTLVDAKNKYFTLRTAENGAYKKGATYTPVN